MPARSVEEQDALLLGELIRVQGLVDAVGDPLRIEHVGIAQARVVLEIQGDAQTVQVPRQALLGLRLLLPELLRKAPGSARSSSNFPSCLPGGL